MPDEPTVFWGETHDNTYQFDEAEVPMQEVLSRAAAHLDFYAAAYYTACAAAFKPGGHLAESETDHELVLEGWKDPERIDREWAAVQSATADANQPGHFVTFPGYEWQGDGSSGDHNVFALREGLPVFRVEHISELYECLRGRNALAIPHHTAYRPGVRGRQWDTVDETLTPFCEIYSVHGCSETDEEWIGLRNNTHMGPGYGQGTWQRALDRGWHLGAVCSTDNWGEMPGCYGNGLMACFASELTREALWDAFKARHVYGVTGDRIHLDFRLNEARMGDRVELPAGQPRRIRVTVRGADALDRVELLRNGHVLDTHCHQGSWRMPHAGQRARFKLRVEAGWGPRPGELIVPDRAWNGRLTLDSGRFLASEPCWVSPGQRHPVLDGPEGRFSFLTTQRTLNLRQQNAHLFEFDADPAEALQIELNGLTEAGPIAEFADTSRELWYSDECVGMLAERRGIQPYSPERRDIYHHVAFKAKLHRAIPEPAYTVEWEVEDTEPLTGETHYRVRVEQRNAQRAWSSPIWVRPTP